MSKPDRSAEEGQGGDERQTDTRDDGRDELKKLFDAIGEQLSDADRRHAATVGEMQSRVSDLGRETETLREHVPEPFNETFGRIEKGVAELAKRLENQGGESTPGADGAGSDLRRYPPPLRASMLPRRSDENTSSRASVIDPFDVIGSDAPDANGEWDKTSADSLNEFYRARRMELADQQRQTLAKTEQRDFGAGFQGDTNADWLEERFSDIAKGIETALAEIKPDSGFRRIGERFDHLEEHITHALEGVATRADLGVVRLIEAHVGEVVNHLAETQHHLTRLNVIEEQLALISQTLGLDSGAVENSGAHRMLAADAAHIDVEAIARAAAEQAAKRVSDVAARKDADELRPLLDRMISDNRTGQANTAMHLDTLQEAMIRVLDRIEAMEFGHQPVATPPEALTKSPLEQQEHGSGGISAPLLTEVDDVLFGSDTLEFGPEEPAAREPSQMLYGEDASRAPDRIEQRRQDFVADARRAKLRLAAMDDDIVITAPAHSGAFAASSSQRVHGADPDGTRPVRRAPAAAKSSGPTAPSPLLIVVAIAALLVLSGLWFVLGAPSDSHPTAAAPTQSNIDTDAGSGSSDAAAPASGQRSEALPGESNRAAALPTGSLGPRTTLPMLGVAVDLDNPATKASLQQAERHQAMATLSGRLGSAAATGHDAVIVPASMVPSESEVEGSNTANGVKSEIGHAGPFDLPAATVGPLSLRLAAANGDPSAQFEVGSRFAEGKGTTQSFKDAAKWYQRSAGHGFAPAQYRLGTLYERGLGVKADRGLAGQWYRRAAELGNVKAMHNLAVLSANQTEGSPDYITAARWFEEAAKRGLADSQFNLAVLYENGLGVNRDLKQAFMWLSLAARGKDTDAVKRRDILRGKMTGDEIAAAEALTSEWRSTAIDRNVNDPRTAGEAWKKNPQNGVSG